jgi:hypothetical protein
MAINVEAACEGKTCLWGAPTIDQTRICWEETRHACGTVAEFRESERIVKFPGGGKIVFRSLDNPDNARGFTWDMATIEEAAYVDERGYYEVLRPALMDTGGSFWAIFTPMGRNWAWRESVAAADRDDAVAWQVPTLGVAITSQGLVRRPHPMENPDISMLEIKQLYRTLPERVFRQEILAEFIEDSGGVFRNVTANVDRGRVQAEPARPRWEYTMGVDLARVEDFTVISVLDYIGRQAYFERFNDISWARQIAAIVRVAQTYKPDIVIDSTGVGDPVVEQLRQALSDANAPVSVSDVTLTNTTKGQLIDSLAVSLDAGRLSLMDIEVQTNELLAYQYEVTAARNVRTNAPPGLHDDTVIALALAHSRVPFTQRASMAELAAMRPTEEDEEDQPVKRVRLY